MPETPPHSTRAARADEPAGTQANHAARAAIDTVANALAQCPFPTTRDALIERVRGWRIPFRGAHIRADLALAQVAAPSFETPRDAAEELYASGALAASIGTEGRVKDHFQGGNA